MIYVAGYIVLGLIVAHICLRYDKGEDSRLRPEAFAFVLFVTWPFMVLVGIIHGIGRLLLWSAR